MSIMDAFALLGMSFKQMEHRCLKGSTSCKLMSRARFSVSLDSSDR